MQKVFLYALSVAGKTEEELTDLCRVSEERLARVRETRNAHARLLSLAAEACLDRALSSRLSGYAAPPRYTRLPGGKPVLADEKSDWHFSLGHAGDLAACVLAPFPVGLDFEKTDRDVTRLAPKVLSPGETDVLRAWVGKESYLKMTGEGISRPMTDFVLADGAVLDRAGNRLAEQRFLERDGYLFAVTAETPFEIEYEP